MFCLHCQKISKSSLCLICRVIYQKSQTRPCTNCKKILNFNEFKKDKKGLFGIISKCKTCRNPQRGIISFEKSFASCDKSKFWSNKNEKSPRQVFKGSEKKFWFGCGNCLHEFEIQLNSVTRGSWCAFCVNKKLCDDTNCDKCFEKSFASSEKLKFWSNKNIESPRQVFKCSNKKFWFNCSKCSHEFEMSLNHVKEKKWCSYCGKQKLCEDDNCDTCFKKSFACSEKSKYWSDKNEENPRQLFKNSGKSFWFDCNKCLHTFNMTLHNITNHGNWCDFCGNKRLCEDTNCDICYNKSFSPNEKSKYWSDKNKQNPRQVFKSCNEKFWFNCDVCPHEFYTRLYSITNGKSWCPACKFKTETLVKDWLISAFGVDDIETQFKINECINERKLPFDFLVKSLKIILELDGLQHFQIVKMWKNCPIKSLKRDIFKMECAEKAGYKMIRIYQQDVWKNSEFYKKVIIDLMKKSTELEQFTFVSLDASLYNNHKNELSS